MLGSYFIGYDVKRLENLSKEETNQLLLAVFKYNIPFTSYKGKHEMPRVCYEFLVKQRGYKWLIKRCSK